MTNKNSTLFIPDISGFTNFVQKNDTKHSQHIISELLETLIDSNISDLKLSEIEGDALLFYQPEELKLLQLFNQARHSYLEFHQGLSKYEHLRICDCGACSNASGLNLKFVAHIADFSLIKVKDQEKPYGEDVILAHRLLKNTVPHKEYLLLPTNEKVNEQLPRLKEHYPWVDPKTIDLEYDDVGTIQCIYIPLEELRKDVLQATAPKNPDKVENPVRVTVEFETDINTLKQLLIDFDFRDLWNKGVEKIEYTPNRVNRINSRHLCVIRKSDDLELETVTNDFGEGNFVLGERLIDPKLFKEFTIYYIIKPLKTSVQLTLEAHFVLPTLLKFILNPLIKMKIQKQFKQVTNNLKEAIDTL